MRESAVRASSSFLRHSSFGFRHSPNTHPACSASRFSASRRIRSLDRRSCRPAPGQSCAGLHPRPWPCGARHRTRKTARPRRRSISRSRPRCSAILCLHIDFVGLITRPRAIVSSENPLFHECVEILLIRRNRISRAALRRRASFFPSRR